MSPFARCFLAAVAGSVLLGLAFTAPASAFEPNWGTPMPIPPSKLSFWEDVDKLGPQPEPPDFKVYGFGWFSIPSDGYAKLSPQPEPPDYEADLFDLLWADLLGL